MEVSEAWHDITIRDICISSNLNPPTKLTSSSRSTDILPWNISKMMIKTMTVSTRITISYAMKWGIPLRVWWTVHGNHDNMIKISRWRKAIVEQILGSEKRKKYKREREISRINRVIQVCLRRNKNVGRIWFKKMFNHQILDEGLKYL